MDYWHLDVFSAVPFAGNSVTVFPAAEGLTIGQMLSITREMRHFESIFLERAGPRAARARVFDLNEELPFAGHPTIGAACVLHALEPDAGPVEEWTVDFPTRRVTVRTERTPAGFRAVLDQGRPEFLGTMSAQDAARFAAAFDLPPSALAPGLPPEVVSTGLRYLIVPVTGALAGARIVVADLDARLAAVGAKFAYLLDVGAPGEEARFEGRHWNNDGVLEDVATASAAGCVAAYLARHGHLEPGRETVLHQGRFLGRPSELRIRAEGTAAEVERVLVGGDAAFVGRGTLEALPPP